jgi:stage IV sporulation protein A
MEQYNVYKDIEARTGGDIYLGIVGPVRTGKSTFIKRFMEQLVMPEIEDEHQLGRTRDELPQSSAGRTIMTTEPKFIPKEAVEISLPDGIQARFRLIDCVGFMVDGATGHIEDDEERMVHTPWFEEAIPFTKAAEIGTRKVIQDHSTIGIVITTDGSFGELGRENYISAENTAIQELKELGKPFLILLNSARPYSESTRTLAQSMEQNYGVSVLPVNCEQLKREDITRILAQVLKEFPVTEVDFEIPKWLEILPSSHWLKEQVIAAVRTMMGRVRQMKDIPADWSEGTPDEIESVKVSSMDLSDGKVQVTMTLDDGCYYQILSDYAGIPIADEYELMAKLKNLAAMQSEYDKVLQAMNQVRMKGYGVVTPERNEIVLDEPEVVKHGNRYGVKMRAEAPSINLLKAQIQTEIAPIVGSEQQALDLIAYMKDNANHSENGIWDTNIFGKSIEQIVEDGIQAKISQMTEECQMKLQDALQKIINDSNGGMICIII